MAHHPQPPGEIIERPTVHGRGLRIRLGLGLVIASWLPIAQIVIWATSASGSRADWIRAVVWSIQVVIGLIGVAVAGAETIRIAKRVGWRRSPAVVWRLLRSPESPPTYDAGGR